MSNDHVSDERHPLEECFSNPEDQTMMRRLGTCSALAALAFAPVAALSADRIFDDEVGAYAGVGVGYGTFENEDFFVDNNELRDDRMTWQAYAGARFIPWFGVEASYVDFGEADGDGGFLDANGAGLGVGLHFPVHETTTLSLRAGQLWWDADGTAVAPVEDFDFDVDGEDPYYGVGAHFGNSEGLGVSVRYDLYELDDTDIEVPSINLEFGF